MRPPLIHAFHARQASIFKIVRVLVLAAQDIIFPGPHALHVSLTVLVAAQPIVVLVHPITTSIKMHVQLHVPNLQPVLQRME